MNKQEYTALIEIIQPTLTEYNLTIHFKKENGFFIAGNEPEGDDYTFYLLNDNQYFKMYITSNPWAKKGFYHFGVETSYRRIWDSKEKYSDGSHRTESEIYEYKYFFKHQEEESFGLTKNNYSYSINELSKDSKIGKNPKLILNDFKAVLVPYLKIMAVIGPRVQDRIDSELKYLETINTIARHFGSWESDKNQNRSFNCKEGKIEVSAYGEISFTRNISIEECLKLTKEEK
jgi:hypothetical protein